MAVYKCSVCGNTYDEADGILFQDLEGNWTCDICQAAKSMFVCVGEERTGDVQQGRELDYPADLFKPFAETEPYMATIHEIAVSGKPVIEPMKTLLPIISWDDILFLGAQLSPFPLEEHAEVNTRTVIGKNAKKPLVLESPLYVTHMSFGALSRELKIALAKGAAGIRTAMCSGEGGILPEEIDASYRYIFEYVPNFYSVTPENLKRVDAIEIKIGQGTKPGMGGHLPGEKVTEEIAMIRNKPVGKDIISPSRIPGINSKEDLKEVVEGLREASDGRPIGVKLAAGHIERDLEAAIFAQPDFVTMDGRGGGTGASPKFLKDSASVPTIFALYRARKYLDEHAPDIGLVITGGLRTPADFIKALAMGADAVALGSAVLMAAMCMQYRQCHNGNCPMGGLTQDKGLRSRLDIEKSAARVANFLRVSTEELKMFARVSGHSDVHRLTAEDLATVNSEISNYTNIRHV